MDTSERATPVESFVRDCALECFRAFYCTNRSFDAPEGAANVRGAIFKSFAGALTDADGSPCSVR